MKTTAISDGDAFELANGRVPARPDLDELADLLTAYRRAAIGSAPRPSAGLSARLDLSATPVAMQRDAVADGTAGANTRRAASGLLGLGVTVAIILGAASGAAAVVGAGSAGSLPPGAQDAFDQVVSVFTPPGVAGVETTDQGEVPGTSTTTPGPQSGADDKLAIPGPRNSGNPGSSHDPFPDTSAGHSGSSNGSAGDGSNKGSDDGNSGNGNGNSGNGNSGNGNGNGNSGSGKGKGSDNPGKGNDDSVSTDADPGNSDGRGNSDGAKDSDSGEDEADDPGAGVGNSDKGNGNREGSAPGDGDTNNGNSGNGNSKKP